MSCLEWSSRGFVVAEQKNLIRGQSIDQETLHLAALSQEVQNVQVHHLAVAIHDP